MTMTDRTPSTTEKASEEGWGDAVSYAENHNKYPEGSPEHKAYENGYQNGLEALP